MNIQTETRTVNNGVNMEALLGARQALTQAPPAAEFTWRVQCDWIDGTHSAVIYKRILWPRRRTDPRCRI